MTDLPVADARRLAGSTGALLTLADLAAHLRIGRATAFRLLAQGQLPPPDVRIGRRILRWRPATIARFIEQGGMP